MSKEPVEDKRIISVRIKRKPEVKGEPSVLYSQKEIHTFVTEFVSSWIRGDIIIRFPTAAELAKADTSKHSVSKRPLSER